MAADRRRGGSRARRALAALRGKTFNFDPDQADHFTTASGWLYAVPMPPLGRSGWVVIARFPAMLSENTFDPVCDALSATCTVNVKVPEELGVPLRFPL